MGRGNANTRRGNSESVVLQKPQLTKTDVGISNHTESPARTVADEVYGNDGSFWWWLKGTKLPCTDQRSSLWLLAGNVIRRQGT